MPRRPSARNVPRCFGLEPMAERVWVTTRWPWPWLSSGAAFAGAVAGAFLAAGGAVFLAVVVSAAGAFLVAAFLAGAFLAGAAAAAGASAGVSASVTSAPRAPS